MPKAQLFLLFTICWILIASAASSRTEELPAERTWTDVTGKYKTRATFAGFADGVVKLKRINGQFIEIAIEKLSGPDQDYVASATRSQPASKLDLHPDKESLPADNPSQPSGQPQPSPEKVEQDAINQAWKILAVRRRSNLFSKGLVLLPDKHARVVSEAGDEISSVEGYRDEGGKLAIRPTNSISTIWWVSSDGRKRVRTVYTGNPNGLVPRETAAPCLSVIVQFNRPVVADPQGELAEKLFSRFAIVDESDKSLGEFFGYYQHSANVIEFLFAGQWRSLLDLSIKDPSGTGEPIWVEFLPGTLRNQKMSRKVAEKIEDAIESFEGKFRSLVKKYKAAEETESKENMERIRQQHEELSKELSKRILHIAAD